MRIYTPKHQIDKFLNFKIFLVAVFMIIGLFVGIFSLVKQYQYYHQPITREPIETISLVYLPSVKEQIIAIAEKENYPADKLIKLAFCESSLNPEAVGDNGQSFGLFQIHQGYHPNTLIIAKDIEKSTVWTINKIKEGRGFLWSCWSKI